MQNFVFHEEYIVDVPEDRLHEFEHYIINYGLYREVPTLTGIEQSFWMQIQRRIDQDNASYEINCLKRKINAIQVRINSGKATENDNNNLVSFKTKLNELNEVKLNNSFKTKLNEKNEVKRTHHVIDNVIVNDIDTVIDTVTVTDIDIKQNQMPTVLSPQQENYSKQIFAIFKDAGLPCARNNEISFLMTDFSNGLSYIHNSTELKGVSSSDIIQACKNYVDVLNDSDSWVSVKMNFYQLVKSKYFYNLLPQNFIKENYLKKDSEQKNETTHIQKKNYQNTPCPHCKSKKVYWSNDVEKYICDSCHSEYEFEEIA